MTDHRLTAERALKEITAALDNIAATITTALDNLATGDTPAPTLVEELRDTARWWRDGAPTWEQCCDRFDALAARAEKIEQDRDDARAEVERLTAEQYTEGPDDLACLAGMKEATRYAISVTHRTPDHPLAERLRYRAILLDNGDPNGDTPKALRDLATRAAHMEHDLAEARARVERLTTERDAYERMYLESRDEATALAEELAGAESEVDRLTAVQKAAESTAETPTPADVQPGEAWLVEVGREKRTAVKDSDAGVPWNTVNTSGVFHAEYNEDVTLLTRLVPAHPTITDPDDLDRAKRDTIIRDARGVVCSRDSAGTAWTTFTSLADQRRHIILPATVLWKPGA